MSQTLYAQTLTGSFVYKQTAQYSAVLFEYENVSVLNKEIINVNSNDVVLYSDNAGNGTDTLKFGAKDGESFVISYTINDNTITFTQTEAITLIASVLEDFVTTQGAESATKLISLSSDGLSNNINVIIPSGTEISIDGGVTWLSGNTTLNANTAYSLSVRLSSSATVGDYSANLVFESGNTTRICTLSGTVIAQSDPTITINDFPESICEGETLNLVAPTVTGNTVSEGWKISSDGVVWTDFINPSKITFDNTLYYFKYYVTKLNGDTINSELKQLSLTPHSYI